MYETAEYWIKQLQLTPHPEGGYFKEIFRSKEMIDASQISDIYKEKRSLATSIFFLLKSGQISAFHRLVSDEIWHHYLGAPIKIYILKKDYIEEIILGKNISQGEQLHAIIPKYNWFAAEILGENTFSIAGCTVVPGFDFRDFELAEKSKLIKEFPEHKELIQKMCIK